MKGTLRIRIYFVEDTVFLRKDRLARLLPLLYRQPSYCFLTISTLFLSKFILIPPFRKQQPVGRAQSVAPDQHGGLDHQEIPGGQHTGVGQLCDRDGPSAGDDVLGNREADIRHGI